MKKESNWQLIYVIDGKGKTLETGVIDVDKLFIQDIASWLKEKTNLQFEPRLDVSFKFRWEAVFMGGTLIFQFI